MLLDSCHHGRMRLTRSHLYHHGRFYVAIAVGVFVYAMFRVFGGPQALAAAGDAFFFVYLAGALGVFLGHTPEDLKRRAARQDEGILIVVAITLVVIAVNVAGVFHALNSGKLDPLSLTLVLLGAPLGWFVLHTIATFHYANMFYFDPPGRNKPGTALDFPGTKAPDLWDFAYFSFVIGMTAQVSDVEVRDSDMRRAVTAHGIVSFFFNTVLIALVVNAVAGR